MSIVNEIISELINENSSLQGPLLKLSVIAHKIRDEKLSNWVESELKGFSNGQFLPSYRIYQGSLVGTFDHGNRRFNDAQIPVIGLNKKYLDNLLYFKFYQSISSLELLIADKKQGHFFEKIPAEINAVIQENFRTYSKANRGIVLHETRKEISFIVIVEILSHIRMSILKTMYEIEKNVENLDGWGEILKSKDKITTIMTQNLITNIGDGNVISTGDNAQIRVKINIEKGDLGRLVSELKEKGVEEKDTIELVQIIETTEIDTVSKSTLTDNINTWISKMYMKALSGTWSIGSDIAGSFLSESIKQYFFG
jgi:hypothetical protein